MKWLTHDLRIATTIDRPIEEPAKRAHRSTGERAKGARRSTGERERWLFDKRGYDTARIAEIVGRTEAEVVKRLELRKAILKSSQTV